MPCLEHLVQVRTVYEGIRSAGGDVLVVTQAKPASLEAWIARQGHPFPVVGDPDKAGYRLYAMQRASLLTLMRPDVIWGYLKIMARGRLPGVPAADADLHQLGGNFVLDASGRVTYAFRSREPTDRPAPEVLLAEVRRAAAQSPATSATGAAP
jgi:peroxiredoxin